MTPTAKDRENHAPLHDLRWGIERETHRILPDGRLSAAYHPDWLRAPEFTRDFAETQLEIVTSPPGDLHQTLLMLNRLTDHAQRVLGQELLWPFSMPPGLVAETDVRIAELGSSSAGRRARLYREGLALRYGKLRQTICGVHANVSPGPALTAYLAREAPLTQYEASGTALADGFALRLARNLYADLPLLILLLGASPVKGGIAAAQGPAAISYRNSPHGYAGAEFVPYLDLESVAAYGAAIERGLRTMSTSFTRLGLVRDGRPQQLNGNVFQVDKEFYAPIRLRQTTTRGETTPQALARRGVGYLELRFIDVDPFSVAGVAGEALLLIHLFVVDGLMRASDPRTNAVLRRDLQAAVTTALKDPLGLRSDPILAVAGRRLAQLEEWAGALDATTAHSPYSGALRLYSRRLADPDTLSSARLARALAESGLDWTSFGAQTAARLRQGAMHALEYGGL
jgi:glutamate--cysteine ligase